MQNQVIEVYERTEPVISGIRVDHHPCFSRIFKDMDLDIPSKWYGSTYGLKNTLLRCLIISKMKEESGMELLPIYVKRKLEQDSGNKLVPTIITILPKYSALPSDLKHRLKEGVERGVISDGKVWENSFQYVIECRIHDESYQIIYELVKCPFTTIVPFVGVDPSSGKGYDIFIVESVSNKEDTTETLDEIYRKLKEIGDTKRVQVTF